MYSLSYVCTHACIDKSYNDYNYCYSGTLLNGHPSMADTQLQYNNG